MLIPKKLRHQMLEEREISLSRIVKASQEISKLRLDGDRTRRRFVQREQMKQKIVGILSSPLLMCRTEN